MPGKIGFSFSGAEIDPPDLTEAMTSSIARSTTVLPAVLPVTSIACMIGTPAEQSGENVRDQRASAIFCTVLPMLTGMRSRNLSHCGRPQSDFFQRRNATTRLTEPNSRMYHWCVTRLDMLTVTCVMKG